MWSIHTKGVRLWACDYTYIIIKCTDCRGNTKECEGFEIYTIYYTILFFCVDDPHHVCCCCHHHHQPHHHRHHPEWHSFGQIPRTATRRVCSTHVRCARYLCSENKIWVYIFSRSKLIHTHTTTTPRGVIFLFKYNPHAIHHAISRLVFVWRVPVRGYCIRYNIICVRFFALREWMTRRFVY